MTLNKTITSHIKPKVVYGKKGDKVKLISKHGVGYVVEDAKGNRFSVLKIDLDE